MRLDREIAKEARDKIDLLLPGAPWTTPGKKAVMDAVIMEALWEVRAATIVALCDLPSAIAQAKAALVGDSNDAEHDALHALVTALGYEVPECSCDQQGGQDFPHDTDCPRAAWQAVQTHICGGMGA